jgi:hypothetical protein
MGACVTALRDASSLIAESLLTKPEERTSMWLLAALAAISGHERLWYDIQHLAYGVECPSCGQWVALE